jgi:L-malate glycosyltransferase
MRLSFLGSRASIHTLRWVNALADRGHEIDLITMHDGGDTLSSLVRVHKLPFGPPVGYFTNALYLRTLLKRIKPDLLNVHYAGGYGTLGRLSGFHPLVLSVWGGDVYDVPARSPISKWLITQNLKSADWVCSTSEVMAKQTRSLNPALQSLTVVPFGVDSNLFYPNPALRDPERITVGTVKTLAPKYGIDILIRAFAMARQVLAHQMSDSVSKLHLTIVGGGPLRAELELLVTELEMSNIVDFVGPVPHEKVPKLLNRFDIYAAMSRLDSESFGVAIVEASACGLPVLVSNVGGLPEVVQHGITGLVVDKEDVQGTADALIRLIGDDSLRRKMGQSGCEHVLTRYKWADNVTQMEMVYSSVLESNKPISRLRS